MVRWAELYIPDGDPAIWYPAAQALAQLYGSRLLGHCYSWDELTRLVATGQIVYGIVPTAAMLPPDREPRLLVIEQDPEGATWIPGQRRPQVLRYPR